MCAAGACLPHRTHRPLPWGLGQGAAPGCPSHPAGKACKNQSLSHLQETAVSANGFQPHKRLSGSLWRPLPSEAPQPEGMAPCEAARPHPRAGAGMPPPLRSIQANNVLASASASAPHASLGRTWRRGWRGQQEPSQLLPTLETPAPRVQASGGSPGALPPRPPPPPCDRHQRPASCLMQCGPQVAWGKPQTDVTTEA